MMLDQCCHDFSALIDRINVQDAFEKADYKDRYKKFLINAHYIVSSDNSTLSAKMVANALTTLHVLGNTP